LNSEATGVSGRCEFEAERPLSSRIDENDAVFILDKVLVPWENVFVYADRPGAKLMQQRKD
jgi:aromatic ring hydroxylase